MWSLKNIYGLRSPYLLFKALAHPVRLETLDMPGRGEICVCHIDTPPRSRQAYISQQLMTLREAELVNSRKDGTQVYYRLTALRIEPILKALMGEPLEDGRIILTDCPCPHFTVIPIERISECGGQYHTDGVSVQSGDLSR